MKPKRTKTKAEIQGEYELMCTRIACACQQAEALYRHIEVCAFQSEGEKELITRIASDLELMLKALIPRG